MKRIYQGRVTKVETLNGKNADGQPQWLLLGFTPEKLEQLEQQRAELRPLTQQQTPAGEDARKKLAEIQSATQRAVGVTASEPNVPTQTLQFKLGSLGWGEYPIGGK